jgi:YesN/AraC family two-component response regulator
MDQQKIIALIAETKKLNLLYVEDNEETRSSTLKMLQNFFDNITVGVDGQDGYEKFEAGTFDLVLSDINMPRLNGIEMTWKIRETGSTTPIVILSAHHEKNYIVDSYELGVDEYLLKPIVLPKLIEVLEAMVEKIKSA